VSWRDRPPNLVFIYYDAWHIVLNSVCSAADDPHRLLAQTDDVELAASILQPEWEPGDWRRQAQARDVQAAVPQLNLATGDGLWAPNRRAARMLRDVGFAADRVFVRRPRQPDR
jgi:hypothetical protein